MVLWNGKEDLGIHEGRNPEGPLTVDGVVELTLYKPILRQDRRRDDLATQEGGFVNIRKQ